MQELRRVCSIGALLEACNFSLFWRLIDGRYKPSEASDEPFKKSLGKLNELIGFKNGFRPEEVKHLVESITGFKEAMRNCADSRLFP